MTNLRQRMIREMNLSGFTAGTQRAYIAIAAWTAATSFGFATVAAIAPVRSVMAARCISGSPAGKTPHAARTLAARPSAAKRFVQTSFLASASRRKKPHLFDTLGDLPEPEFTHEFC